LTNPNGDNLKAASFLALRRSNPNMGYFDLIKEQQKGLGSANYLRSMVEFSQNLGGDETMQKLNLANALGLRNNLAAVDTIYKNRSKILNGNFSTEELTDLGKGTNLKDRAVDNTTVLEKNTADISNKLLSGWLDTLDAMQESFSRAIQQVVDGVNVVTDSNGRMQLNYSPTKASQTKKASDAKKTQEMFKQNGLNPDGTLNRGSSMNRQI
jgi:hypothetical protein